MSGALTAGAIALRRGPTHRRATAPRTVEAVAYRRLAAYRFIAAVVVVIAFGPLLAPYSATEFHPLHALQPPGQQFPFGADEFGRDVFSRIIIGARPTLLLAISAAALGVLLGSTTGLIAGYSWRRAG